MSNQIPLFGRANDIDDQGDVVPVTNAVAYFYQTGSTTPLTVYADSGLTTPLGSSVAADADGLFPVCWTDRQKILIDIRNGSGVSLDGFPQDDVLTISEGGQAATSITATAVPGNTGTTVAEQLNNNTGRLNRVDNGKALPTSSGSGGAYSISPQFSITGYAALQEYEFVANHTSIGGGADTLNVDGQGAIGLRKYDSTPAKVQIEAGDIRTGDVVRVKHDGTHFVLAPAIPQAATTAQIDAGTPAERLIDLAGLQHSNENLAIFVDQKADTTPGGTFTSGAWQIRDLNTTRVNNISGVSLAANQITLPAGTYEIEASAPARQVDLHKARLFNVTDAVTAIVGTSEVSEATGTIATPRSFILGEVTIASAKSFRLEHRCSTTRGTDGFGSASSFGEAEVYSIIKIRKLS